MTQERIDFSGLTILVSDDQRDELAGSYTVAELAQLFLSDWIPYLECHKCGRHTYCMFVKPHPYPEPRSVGRLAEIRCGVVETMINNYVRGVFPLLQSLSREQLQDFLDGSYHLVEFVYQAELQIGHMIDQGVIDYLGNADYRAEFFGITAQFRRHLDRFAATMRSIPTFRTVSTIILTEGASEKAFLEKLKETRLLWFIDLEVESYYGRGNRGPGKLEMLARRLRQQGYQLFLQGDCDGRIRDIFHQLVQQGIVEAGNTFAFEVDFETSFPVEMLFAALEMTDTLDHVPFEDFQEAVTNRKPTESVLQVLDREFGVELNKIELAEALGTLFNDHHFWHPPDGPFWSAEIGHFLDKIRRLP